MYYLSSQVKEIGTDRNWLNGAGGQVSKSCGRKHNAFC